MRIMTRMGKSVLELLEKTNGEFTKCLHGKADLNVNRRLILHFPTDNTIWSVGSGYGGNALLGKKCLSLRIGSWQGRNEGWMAEHMLIMGVEDPSGYIAYIAAAFPSACGKTNLAMLLPPQGLKRKGYRIWTVGDDIAWMRIDTDGKLWAVNPENGLFGVAPGTNTKTNPTLMAAIQKNTIYTNVLLKKDKTVWWEGGDPPVPEAGINWQGLKWKPGQMNDARELILGAHPNARFTVPITNVASITNRIEHHHGVPISAIIFGGRRASLAPLVYESFDWQHGVFVGATMASERTAAQMGKQGEVRRDPMAMLPFCGYNMGEYFAHWLEMGDRMTPPPKIFHVNWFRKDEEGKFLWPGYGENLRVLEWVISRCKDEMEGVETPIGYLPHENDIDMTGLRIPRENMHKLLSISKEDWKEEAASIAEFFKTFGKDLPPEMNAELKGLQRRLGK
jgi:phosphoenolpyruvate carboxykinase (GTP)